MNKLIFTFLILIGFNSQLELHAQESQKANALLNEVSEKMATYQNMYIKFKYILENKEVDIKQESEGIAYTSGEKYNLNFMGNIFIFNGLTTYIVLEEEEEINIVDEDSEELLTPTKLFNFYKEGYNYQLETKEKRNNKTLQVVKLIPMDSNSESAYFLLSIDLDSKNIESILNIGNNGTETLFRITEFKTNLELSDELFTFDKNMYPNYTINE
jgi:outer membrane lipoprotein-sorting protein